MNTFQMRRELEEAGVSFTKVKRPIGDCYNWQAVLDKQLVASERTQGDCVQQAYKKLGG